MFLMIYLYSTDRSILLRSILSSGARLAEAVRINAAPQIEAERYFTSFAHYIKGSRNVPSNVAEALDKQVSYFNARFVIMKDGDQWKLFRLLKYDDNDKCVIKGPIKNLEDEGGTVSTVERNDVRIPTGIPVICHGLKGNKSRANGKIGVVGSINSNSNVCTVHFEDPKIGRGVVGQENLSVLFDLPAAPEQKKLDIDKKKWDLKWV